MMNNIVDRYMPNFFCVSLLALCLLSTPTRLFADTPPKSATEGNELPLKDLRLFTLIFDHIRRSYVEPISDQQLFENAIKGMLQEMDPHSAYLDASSFQQIRRSTEGKFSGVGIEIGIDDEYIRIISPIDDSPAQRAGLQAGDLIIKLDQESILGLSLSEASEKIRGPIGTKIVFTVVREGIEDPFDITVTRNTIKSSSLSKRIIDKTIAYIRIAEFQGNTGQDFKAAITSLRQQQPALTGMIIDLRNNPGGVLQASVEVVDSLIDEGLIVYTQGRLEASNNRYEATAGNNIDDLPLVVLVNGGSASASEIVAGALQDQRRAIIMGTRTFGKGSVQTILPVGKEKGIKLTTARYFTPSGRSIQAQGIIPDIIIKPATITEIEDYGRISEADLEGHLDNDTDEDSRHEEGASDSNTNDNQLFEAINLLKGFAILNQQNND